MAIQISNEGGLSTSFHKYRLYVNCMRIWKPDPCGLPTGLFSLLSAGFEALPWGRHCAGFSEGVEREVSLSALKEPWSSSRKQPPPHTLCPVPRLPTTWTSAAPGGHQSLFPVKKTCGWAAHSVCLHRGVGLTGEESQESCFPPIRTMPHPFLSSLSHSSLCKPAAFALSSPLSVKTF